MYLVKCLLVVMPEETITQPQEATAGQFLRDKNVPLLFNGEHEWSEMSGVEYFEKGYLSKTFFFYTEAPLNYLINFGILV